MLKPKVIDSFRGEYFFLSNFFEAMTPFEEKFYPTAEHAFQAAKTTNKELRQYIYCSATPKEAKRRGRALVIRDDWEDIKLDTMYRIVTAKFATQYWLCQKLCRTEDALLVEGNTHGDEFWGMVLGAGGWVGENHLGKILMRVRDEAYRVKL